MQNSSFVMMALGAFRFSLETAAYQELDRTSAWRWPAIERIGARPTLQFVGPGEDRITMRGIVFPHYRGGLGQVAQMRAEAHKGLPLHLVDGTGLNWGEYVITEVREGQSIFFSNGMPRSQTFELSLLMYPERRFAVAAAELPRMGLLS